MDTIRGERYACGVVLLATRLHLTLFYSYAQHFLPTASCRPLTCLFLFSPTIYIH
jgi:hypothetical protein